MHHEVLSGLKYLQVVKRKGIRVSKDEEMLVSLVFIACVPRLYMWVEADWVIGKLCSQHNRQDRLREEM